MTYTCQLYLTKAEEKKKNWPISDRRMFLFCLTMAGVELWEGLISQELVYRFQKCYLKSRIFT